MSHAPTSDSSSRSKNFEAAPPTRISCSYCEVLREVLRESVPAVIALAILAVALWMLVDVHQYLEGDPKPDLETYQRKKDVLLLALGFLGTVTGYYFGRIPAERHADAARDAAKTAQARELNVRQKMHTELAHIRHQHNQTTGATANDEVNAAIDRLHSSL